jgi:hypothetical protein
MDIESSSAVCSILRDEIRSIGIIQVIFAGIKGYQWRCKQVRSLKDNLYKNGNLSWRAHVPAAL